MQKVSEAVSAYCAQFNRDEALKFAAAGATQFLLEHKLFSHLGKLYQKAERQAARLITEGNPAFAHAHFPNVADNIPALRPKGASLGSPVEKVEKAVNLAEGKGSFIKVFEESVVRAKLEHIFSLDHREKGIMNLGDSREDIIEKALDIAWKVDAKALLKDGSNQIYYLL